MMRKRRERLAYSIVSKMRDASARYVGASAGCPSCQSQRKHGLERERCYRGAGPPASDRGIACMRIGTAVEQQDQDHRIEQNREQKPTKKKKGKRKKTNTMVG